MQRIERSDDRQANGPAHGAGPPVNGSVPPSPPRFAAERLQRARQVKLKAVPPAALDIRRRGAGRGFSYIDRHGQRIADEATLARIRALVLPPAWRDVRIAADPGAHIQAVGRDQAGRVQYRYHAAWDDVREAHKLERLGVFAAALPKIRRRIARDLRQPGTGRSRALAAVVTLVDRTHIRIGHEDYVHSGRSRGAASLLKRNVRVEGQRIQLTFRGKGGKDISCSLRSPALAAALADLGAIPGRRLFQYKDDEGRVRRITAHDVNEHLRLLAAAPVSAKDFRTLAATAAAAECLLALDRASSPTGRKRQLASVYRQVSGILGNTPATARKSYIQRRVVEAFENGTLDRHATDRPPPLLRTGEALIVRLLAGAPQRRRQGRAVAARTFDEANGRAAI